MSVRIYVEGQSKATVPPSPRGRWFPTMKSQGRSPPRKSENRTHASDELGLDLGNDDSGQNGDVEDCECPVL